MKCYYIHIPDMTFRHLDMISNCSTAVHEGGFSEKLDELEQGTAFLHENGILLHYEDSSLLSDLYFLNPQWLCSMLASVVTVQEKNPFQKNGEPFFCCFWSYKSQSYNYY